METYFAQEVTDRIAEIPALALAAKRARRNKTWKLEHVKTYIAAIRKFASFFDVPLPTEWNCVNEDDLDAQIEAARVSFEAEEKEKREKVKAAQQARIEEEKERLARWLCGERVWGGLYFLPYAYLRVSPGNPDTVETTRGASVPLADVQKYAPIVLRAIEYATRKELLKNSHTDTCRYRAIFG